MTFGTIRFLEEIIQIFVTLDLMVITRCEIQNMKRKLGLEN